MMNMKDPKMKKLISKIVVWILILAMVVPMVLSVVSMTGGY